MKNYDVDFLSCINKIKDDSDAGDKLAGLIEAAELFRHISGELATAYHISMCASNEPYRLFFPDEELPSPKGESVILVSHELTRTGAPVVLADMARVFVEKGFLVVVVSSSDGPMTRVFNQMGCIVIVQPALEKGRYNTDEVLEADELVLLKSLMGYARFTVFCTLVLHNVVKHFIDTEYNIYWWLHEGTISFRDCRPLLPTRLSDNIKLLSVCEYVENKFAEFGLENYSGRILNYMVEDIENPEALGRSSEKRDDIVRFVCVGTVDFRKGQDILVEAIKLLPLEYLKKTSFGFVGYKHNPYIVSKVEKLAEAFPNVVCYNEMSREEVFALYEDVDCIISPSRDDPMPVVLTENMRLGNICMCSSCTGTSFYIEDGQNGFVFINENAKQLSEKIMYIVDHYNELEGMKRKSRQLYEAYFTKERFVENLEKLILAQ